MSDTSAFLIGCMSLGNIGKTFSWASGTSRSSLKPAWDTNENGWTDSLRPSANITKTGSNWTSSGGVFHVRRFFTEPWTSLHGMPPLAYTAPKADFSICFVLNCEDEYRGKKIYYFNSTLKTQTKKHDSNRINCFRIESVGWLCESWWDLSDGLPRKKRTRNYLKREYYYEFATYFTVLVRLFGLETQSGKCHCNYAVSMSQCSLSSKQNITEQNLTKEQKHFQSKQK